jgi:ATP synthase protein I
MLQPYRRQAYKLVLLQIAVVLALFLCWWIFQDIKAGYSALLGGLAGVIPSLYFVKKLFSSKERSMKKIMLDFYLGEFTKLFLSAILLVLIFKYIPVKLVPLITGFIGAYMAIWLAPLVLIRN